jgi:hypothetical protein
MHVHTVTKRDMILKGKAYFDVIGQITKASAHPVPSREPAHLAISSALALHNFALAQASATDSPRTASCPGTMQIFVKTRESKRHHENDEEMY